MRYPSYVIMDKCLLDLEESKFCKVYQNLVTTLCFFVFFT
jgi:hypothetical protein